MSSRRGMGSSLSNIAPPAPARLSPLEAARTERNGAAWTIAISLGVRRGEVPALRRAADVDLDEGALWVRRKLQRRSWKRAVERTLRGPRSRDRVHRKRPRGCQPACPPGCTAQ